MGYTGRSNKRPPRAFEQGAHAASPGDTGLRARAGRGKRHPDPSARVFRVQCGLRR